MRGAVAVVHGGAVDAALLLAIAAVGRATTVRRTTPTSPLASPSSTSGGVSGTCIHIVLVLSCIRSARRGTILHARYFADRYNNRFLVRPRFGHMHGPCAENPVRLKLTLECLLSVMASGARGRGGPAREHGHWKHMMLPLSGEEAQVLSQLVLHNSNDSEVEAREEPSAGDRAIFICRWLRRSFPAPTA